MKSIELAWIAGVIAPIVGALIQVVKIRLKLREDAEGRRRSLLYTCWVAAFSALPFVAMGLLLLTRRVDSIQSFFIGIDSTPWIDAWYGLLFVDSAFWLAWLFFFGGAEFLSAYPFLINLGHVNRNVLKRLAIIFFVVFWLLFVVVKIAWWSIR
jgi:hypothetical protein